LSLAARLAAPAAFAAIVLSVPATGTAVVSLGRATALPNVDVRAHLKPTAAQLKAAKAIPGAHVTWNTTGTAGSVFRYGGYLARGLRAPSAQAAARSWLTKHRALFGLRSTAGLRLVSAASMRGAPNDRAVLFRQTFGGVVSADGLVTVGVVGPKRAGWKITYVSSTLTPGGSTLRGKRALSPLDAWTKAARFARRPVARREVTSFGTTAGTTKIIATGFHGAQSVQPIAFGTARGGAVRAYQAQVVSTTDGNQSAYDVIVDAATGKLLYRQSEVFNAADNPTWTAFANAPAFNPLNAFPWNYPSTDIRRLFCWTATAGCANVVSDASTVYPMGVASKFPWDVQLDSAGTDLGTTQTTGNNNDEIQRWVASGPRLYGIGPHAVSATRDYTFPFTNAWFTSGCNPAVLNGSGNDIDAAMTNLFVGHNVMHDYAYYLGFDEGHWNMQQYNNGVTEIDPYPVPGGPAATPVGNDGVLGNAQAGAIFPGSRDNANMNTGADGNHPTTNMFLWQSLPGSFYAPCVDGDYDFSVYGHEFGHAIENRMIGKGVGARQGTHAGGMGEAFGDFDALEVMNALHVAPVPGSDRYTEGAYVTGNPYNGIRDFLAGRPMGGEFPRPGKNPDTDPLNYGDYGFDNVGPEVHADGEIWIAVNIDLRDLMLSRYPSSGAAEDIACVRGQLAATACAGDRRWIQDYYDAMVLMPRNTTMIQARDAILAADLGRFGGANRDLIWQAFAMRGFGQFQSTISNADTNPVPDFSSPMANNATLNFFAVSKDGSSVPVNAKIYVGDYEARATQIADTDPSTVPGTGNLDNTAQFVPSGAGSLAPGARWTSYNFTAVAPGYGFVRFKVNNLQAGQTRNITIDFPTNYASSTQGATIAGDALGTNTNLPNLIDDTEATNGGQTGAPVGGRWVVVALGTDKPVGIKSVGVSALLVPGDNRFTALRSFELYSCRSGNTANPTCDGSIAAGWTKIVTSPANAFPSVNPRPVAPDMTMRFFAASPQPIATHVKLVVDTNQCTGQTSYQGDQDLDPAVNADCRTGTGVSRATEVHASELGVFGTEPTVDG
jgi:hypothetical protein